MCIPAVALPLVAAGVSAAGSLVGGIQANQQGKYEAGIDQINARMATQAAKDSERIGRDEAKSYYRDVAQTKGQNIAAMAANGIDVGFGTAERVQEDTQLLADEDAQKLYRNIANRTKGYVIESYNDRAAAKAAKAKGKAALIGSFFEAGSSLASGFSQFAKAKAALGTSHG
jgi:hypothetical protein